MQGTIGNYELVRLLARGGMADVYLARQLELDRLVAVKVLDETRIGDPDARAMFLDEARLGSMLCHQNLPFVYDVAETADTYYLAMEYLDGADLRALLAASAAAGRRLPVDAAIAIVMAAAAGLEHAHAKRVVHRDVSLTNIMVTHDGQVKVIDFGIAKTRMSTHQSLPGMVRGKTKYMSPEQCLGEKLDARSDVFSLGIVLYELVTGQRCFEGGTDVESMVSIIRGDYIAPCAANPELPFDLGRVIVKALSIDPAQRYASAGELLAALEDLGWTSSTAVIAQLMSDLFGGTVPAITDDDFTASDSTAPTKGLTRRNAR
jgi:serine/threonine-protein kinase